MHLENYKSHDVKRIGNEHERNGNYKDSEQHIDASRTAQNMCVSKSHLEDRLKDRLESVQHSNRKDLNVMSEWVITFPQGLEQSKANINKFFAVANKFFQERYGKENMLNAYIHMDETTPHMHFDFVPVKDGRVCAKQVCTRAELRNCHKDMDEVMQSEFGIKGLILNGRTKGGYTTKELKERTRQEQELKERQQALDVREQAIREREQAQQVQFARRATALDEREKKLNAREQELDRRSLRSDMRKEALDHREDDIKRTEEALRASEKQFAVYKQGCDKTIDYLCKKMPANANSIKGFFKKEKEERINTEERMKQAQAMLDNIYGNAEGNKNCFSL